MSVRYREERKAWEVATVKDGKRVRKLFATEAEAKAFEGDTRASAGLATVGVLFPQWAEEIWKGTKNYQGAIGNTHLLVKLLGANTLVKDVDRERVKEITKTMREVGAGGKRPNKQSSINRKLAALSKLLNYAIDEGVVATRPKLGMKSDPTSKRVRVLTDQEEADLFHEFASIERVNTIGGAPSYEVHRHFFNFCLYTACRPSEARNLQWGDVDWEADDGEGSVTFWDTKTSATRTIPAHRKAMDALRWTQELGWPTPFYYVSHATFSDAFQAARDRAGISKDVIPYTLRHTCATRLAKGNKAKGIEPWDQLRLMIFLGHTTPAMTKRYTHLAVSSLREGVSGLGADTRIRTGKVQDFKSRASTSSAMSATVNRA